MPSPLLPLSEIPSLTLLYKLRRLAPSLEEPAYPANAQFNDVISLIQHDITAVGVSAIVNAANRYLRGGGGVDGVIHARAGPGLLEECRELQGCATGGAKITGAYKLPCDKVIHAVGPIYQKERAESPEQPAELLRSCYRTSLQLATENKCKSIAFSCISTGVYGYPSYDAAEVVVKFMRKWMEAKESTGFDGLERIVFCCFDKKDVTAYEELLPLYFPPVNEHLKNAKEDEETATALGQSMPDPPTKEPATIEQPDAKKRKTAASDDDWEEVEKPSDFPVDDNQGDSVDGNKKAIKVVGEEKGVLSGLQKDW